MVNMYKLKLTSLQQEILRVLYVKAGSALNQRRIAEVLDVTSPAVMKAIPELEKQDFVKIKQDKESKRWSIELNRDKTIQMKKIDNLRQIYASGFNSFIENELAGATIILFGSYSRGEDLFNSDIDIAVIGRKEKRLELSKYEKILERKININFYESWNKIHVHLKNNILSGALLSGSVEL